VAGGPRTFEWLAKKKTGEAFWTEMSLNLTELGDKSFVIAVQRDIDAKKKAEQILAAEQERLAVTLRSIGDGVITTDIEGKIVLINKTAEQIAGWTAGEALGKPASAVFNIIDERSGRACEKPEIQILKTGRLIQQTSQRLLITKDGRRVPIADSGAPICDKESKIIGVVLVFRDITNEKKTEQELLKIRKLESVGVLAGGIAHDFNNILSAILGNIELSSKILGKEHEVSSLLSDAISATFRASKLTQQLLTFAKGGEPIKETTALPDIVKESAEFVLHGSNITCTYDCPEDLWFANVDTGQIGQVIQNIILNARHAMPDGGRIKIKGENITNQTDIPLLDGHTGKFIKIVVRDSGLGIPREFIDKIFDPYFSTKQEGSGLGLAISHSIISKHNGYLTAESTPGEGSVFTIYLPATTEPVPQGKDRRSVSVPARTATIMIMDDEEVVRNVTKSQLEFLGHRVIVVSDGVEAIAENRKMRNSDDPVDIIIMDLTIPGGMGGREAVQKILKEDPDAKVIVSSGYSTDPVMAEYRKYGFSATLSKPVVIDELEKVILSVL
jgi:PAS domain S-box-containing protein